MRIIISPAKKMNVDTDTVPYQDLPAFLSSTRILMEYMRGLSISRCRSIWKCNEKLAELNYDRFQKMELERNLTPALLSYEGIQYQYLSPRVLEAEALAYLQEHLRILSGFYGILKPFDGVAPYRLEMQARLGGDSLDSLYDFWGNRLAEALFQEDTRILNLASKEYSKCIAPYRKDHPEQAFVTCVFGEVIQGKVVEKGTLAKMARGEMVRYLACQKAEDWGTVKEFRGLDYAYSEEWSDENTFVFLKTKKVEPDRKFVCNFSPAML